MIKGQKNRSTGMKMNTLSNPTQNSWITGEKSTLQDFYSVLEPVARIWRVAAIFPFVTAGPVGFRKYVLNKFLVGHCIFTVCIFLGLFIRGCFVYEQLFRRRSFVTIISLFLKSCSSITCELAIVVSLMFHRQKFQRTMELLASQDTILRQLGCRLDYNLNTKRMIIFVLTVLIVTILQSSLDFTVHIVLRGRPIILSIFWSLPLMIYVLSVTLFVCLVIMIGIRFRAINENLKVIIAKTNVSSPKTILVTRNFAERICSIAETHCNLCKVAININYIFNWNLVPSMLMSFVILTIVLHYVLAEMMNDHAINYMRVSCYLSWGCIHAMTIFLIAMACNWTRNQAIYAARLVHRININDSDETLYYVVQSFSLQMHHQKVAFSGGGAFPLDLTLLRSIAGAVTTYLVILIQIEMPTYRLS